ncbi:MAG: glycerol kinase [Theionarchaea archaeon]|nr:glycerol kinase [Theionarchaea archaeon]
MKYILVVDAGTTSIRSMIFDKETRILSQAFAPIPQIYPHPGWIEQDPCIIAEKCIEVIKTALHQAHCTSEDIAAMGITNQRSTSVIWEKETGTPIHNAITWQDTRAADLCMKMNSTPTMRFLRGVGSLFKSMAGFPPVRSSRMGKMLMTISTLSFSPATSLAHLGWIFNTMPEARERAKRGELLAGTVDTWLIWNLTKGKIHATDYSNASATNMYDTFKLQWSDLFLNMFEIPRIILPEVRETSGDYGETHADLFGTPIPITGVCADQQSALFGETCFTPGDVKCTHGTGTFLDMNVGGEPPVSFHKLIPLIAWVLNGKVTYMLEGFLGATGCAIEWLCDGLQIIQNPSESAALAEHAPDTGGVYVVPAFQGLLSPYWDPRARGLVIGLTRDTKKEQVVRATLEGVAYRCKDILLVMHQDSGVPIRSIKADGGASQNDFLLQFMADMLDVTIERPALLETTCLGVAFFAGLAVGYWTSQDEIRRYWKVDRTFESHMTDQERKIRYNRWKNAVKRSFNWV